MADEIDRLTVVWDANFDKLNQKLDKAIRSHYDAAGKITKSLDGLDSRWDKLFGRTDPGKALDNVFSSTRFKLLDSGVARVGLFGGAIEALGPVGLIAAAGIGAFFLSMDQTDKAIEAAASVGKLATELGVSTDFVQQFNFALSQSDVNVGAGDVALKALNQTLGSVQGNLPRAKQLATVFADALNITPDQLRGYHDVGDLLPVLADRIKAAGSAAEQAAIAKKFGVEDLLPLLKLGGDAFNKLAQEATDLGVVLDHELIEKAEAAKKKLAEIADVTKAQATATFAEFADTLIAVKNAFAQAELAGLKFLASVTNTTPIDEKLKDLVAKRADLIADNKRNGLIENTPRVVSINGEINALELARVNAKLKAADAAPTAGAARQFTATKTKATRTDTTQAAIDDSLAKEAGAHATLLEALLAQASDLETQLDLTRQITDAEKARVDDETAKKIAEVEASKSIQATAKPQIEANLQKAAADQKAAIDAKAIAETVKQQLAAQHEALDAFTDHLTAQADIFDAEAQLATTLTERAALEKSALALRQKVETAQARQALVDAFATGDLTKIGKASQAFDDLGVKHTLQTQAQTTANAGPVDQYLRSIQDLNTEFQEAGVSAAKSLASGLADAIVNAKNLGDVASSVFKQLLSQILTSVLEKDVTGPLLAAIGIPHFASGGLSAGGMSLVGENGPELVNLPGGSQVISNAQMRSMTAVGVRPAAAASSQPVVFDLRGAVMTSDLLQQMNQIAARTSGVAVSAARKLTRSDLQRASARSFR